MQYQSVFCGPDDLQRSHLSDARTWTHNDADVTLHWAGDHRRSAVYSDDSGRAGEATALECKKHGAPVTHGDSRKRKDVYRGTDGGNNQRKDTEGFKLQGTNQYPTIVGLTDSHSYNYLGVIRSTLQLNRSIRKSPYGLDLILQQLGLRHASSCDTQCHGEPVHLFNTTTMDYEPHVIYLLYGSFGLLRADYFFPIQDQYFNGQRVAYDGRITDDMAPHMPFDPWMIQRSEGPSHGMYQMPADRLQQQFGQLPMEDRNPIVLSHDHVQLNPNCRTSQQPAAPVDARYSMTHSTQSPYVTHLYQAAAQPSYRGDANCTLKFNDYGTHVPPRTKKKRIVYCRPNQPGTLRSHQRKDYLVQFIGPPALIDHLKDLIRRTHGMSPGYSECEDIGMLNAHPPWARNLSCSELEDKDECSTSSPIDSKPDNTIG